MNINPKYMYADNITLHHYNMPALRTQYKIEISKGIINHLIQQALKRNSLSVSNKKLAMLVTLFYKLP